MIPGNRHICIASLRDFDGVGAIFATGILSLTGQLYDVSGFHGITKNGFLVFPGRSGRMPLRLFNQVFRAINAGILSLTGQYCDLTGFRGVDEGKFPISLSVLSRQGQCIGSTGMTRASVKSRRDDISESNVNF